MQNLELKHNGSKTVGKSAKVAKAILLVGGLAIGMTSTGGGSQAMAQAKVDAEIQNYTKTSGVSGNLGSVGSDTLNNLMTLWAETFRKN